MKFATGDAIAGHHRLLRGLDVASARVYIVLAIGEGRRDQHQRGVIWTERAEALPVSNASDLARHDRDLGFSAIAFRP